MKSKKRNLILVLSVILCFGYLMSAAYAIGTSNCSNEHSCSSMSCRGMSSRRLYGTSLACYQDIYHQCVHDCPDCGYSRMFDHQGPIITTHASRWDKVQQHYECTICGFISYKG